MLRRRLRAGKGFALVTVRVMLFSSEPEQWNLTYESRARPNAPRSTNGCYGADKLSPV